MIDRKILVIGSMNLDPRSAHLNTELALVIHNPVLAEQVAAIFDRATAPEVSYRVTLADDAQIAYLRSIGAPLSPLVWTDVENGKCRTYIFDPQARFVPECANRAILSFACQRKTLNRGVKHD